MKKSSGKFDLGTSSCHQGTSVVVRDVCEYSLQTAASQQLRLAILLLLASTCLNLQPVATACITSNARFVF
jgi:hypothetical protein